MKLLFCIIQEKFAFPVIQTLNEHNIRSTKLSSSGGFLKKGSTTLMLGIADERKEEIIKIIEEACDKVAPGGKKGSSRVTLFVVDALSGAKVKIDS